MATSKATGEPFVIDAHGRHAQAVAFTKDGKLLVSTGQDACVRLWSVPGFEAAAVFEGHTNSVNSISFSPDSALLATGSTDGTNGYGLFRREPACTSSRSSFRPGFLLTVRI